jgi:acetylornithine deacetylase/succinyl-diaminopimelate desuccinylase-like protein
VTGEAVASRAERELVAFARELVAMPSLSGGERPVSERLAAELERLGYRDVVRTRDLAGRERVVEGLWV